MNAEPATVLTTSSGAIVPLQRVRATGRVDGLLFKLTVEQHYRNTSGDTLETVYTFPLPVRAVLLGLELELNGTLHTATAFPRAQAERRYERAIDTGDSAALLTHNGHGLHTVSLGNLQAGDTAVIRYRYAELLSAHDEHVRLAIPTVIAPRYGDPGAANLEGPAIPGSDFLAEYPFDVRIELAGFRDAAAVRSPSHALRVEPFDAGLAVSLARKGFLDRDLVLELKHAALPKEALIAPDGQDGEGCVVLASTALPRRDADHRPLTLKLLLDCSGSMQGGRIEAARRALLAILDRLRAGDALSLSRFGSRVEHVSEGLEPADAHTLEPLKLIVRRMEADLGGTEMAQALRGTLKLTAPSVGPVDLLLVTDGEVHDLDGVLAAAAKARHRLFVIAIGSAPNEALARELAESTGGACEFIAPGEDAESAILRTFDRLRATPLKLADVDWSAPALWTTAHAPAVFTGDTLHRFAGFASRPAGPITFTVADAEGTRTSVALPLATRALAGDVLPRLAAARRLASLPQSEAAALALRHQLVSEHTSFVLVAERADKATDLPATIALPHMAPADGLVQLCATPVLAAAPAQGGALDRAAPSARVCDVTPSFETLDQGPAPATPRRRSVIDRLLPSRRKRGKPVQVDAFVPVDRPGPQELDALLASLAAAVRASAPLPVTLADLCAAHPVPAFFVRGLKHILDTDGSRYETTVIRAFIAALADALQGSADAVLLLDQVGSILRQASYRELRRRIEREVLA